MSGPLEIRNLSAGYGERLVLSNLTLSALHPGQAVSLVGPNGAGKSTLLRAIAGLLPASGHVRLGDLNLGAMSVSERARHVAYMPQSMPQDVALTVLETVIAALEASPNADNGIRAEARAIKALERVGAADLALKRLDRLSGGQRQIAALAQAIVREPRVLLLDEPTSALDLRHQFEVLDLARDYARANEAVVVLVLHDLQAATRVSDHIAVLSGGVVRVEGAPDQTITSDVLAEVWQVRARVVTSLDGQLQVLVEGVV